MYVPEISFRRRGIVDGMHLHEQSVLKIVKNPCFLIDLSCHLTFKEVREGEWVCHETMNFVISAHRHTMKCVVQTMTSAFLGNSFIYISIELMINDVSASAH